MAGIKLVKTDCGPDTCYLVFRDGVELGLVSKFKGDKHPWRAWRTVGKQRIGPEWFPKREYVGAFYAGRAAAVAALAA
jgi:hypothetical protein